MMSGPVLFRADAGLHIGTGHIMRCIALAQELQTAGRECIFLSAMLSPPLIERLHQEGFGHLPIRSEPGSSADALEVTGAAERIQAAWLVLDGYHFSYSYQRTVRDGTNRLLLINDDGSAGKYAADIILNQNLHTDRDLYPLDDSSTRLLLGTDYTLLRREFRQHSGERTFPEIASRLLVTFGGSDPDNVTGIILQGLALVPVAGGEVVVVIGGSNPHIDSLRAAARDARWSVRFARDVRDMAALMRGADLAVTASGGTVWELAATGVPAIVVPIADNQMPVAHSFHQRQAGISLGPAAALIPESVADVVTSLIGDRSRRSDLSSNARKLVDGRGAARVVETMVEIETGMSEQGITVRHADSDDAHLLWEWTNEPAVRAVSFSSDPIPWEDHLRWLARRLNDPDCRLYIGINDYHDPVGQVRFDIDDLAAMLSVSLDARFRGRGYGAPLLRQASRALFAETMVNTIRAFVKPMNNASLRVFRKAGFSEAGTEIINGQTAICFLLNRNMIS